MSREPKALNPARVMLRLCAALVMLHGFTVPTLCRADVATKAGEKTKDKKDDKKKEFDFLPEARNTLARFVAGSSVDIEIVASVGTLKQVEFAVRQAPLHGVLSVPRPHPREAHKAVITYTHRGAEAPLQDAFTFACRLSGGAWSAPATVTLTGERMGPRLEVIGTPVFGRVFLGGEATARVAVRNTGTVDAQVKLAWPEPWSGPPQLEVTKGGMVEFPVLFRPRKAGEFRHDTMLQSGQPLSRVIFYGESVQAFSASPGSLTLTRDAATGERVGLLTLSNARPESVRAVFKLPARVQGPSETEIAASSKISVRIVLPAGDVNAFAGDLVVQSGGDVQRVILEAKATPAVMQIIAPQSGELNFGTVDARAGAEREVVITNAGGEPLVVEARARPPFSVGQPVVALRIEPGSIGKVKVALSTSRVGAALGTLELATSTKQSVVTLRAEVREAQKSTPQSAPASGPAASTPQPAPAMPASPAESQEGDGDGYVMRSAAHAVVAAIVAARGLPVASEMINPFLERVRSVEVIATAPTQISIAWAKPKLPPSGWSVEFATTVLDSNTGIAAKMWNRHRDWEPVDAGSEKIGIRLRELRPASQYELRVLGVDREGKLSEPSPPLLVYTAEPWRVPAWVWSVLTAAVFGLIAHTLFRYRRGDFSARG